jgi:hypothetical protein
MSAACRFFFFFFQKNFLEKKQGWAVMNPSSIWNLLPQLCNFLSIAQKQSSSQLVDNCARVTIIFLWIDISCFIFFLDLNRNNLKTNMQACYWGLFLFYSAWVDFTKLKCFCPQSGMQNTQIMIKNIKTLPTVDIMKHSCWKKSTGNIEVIPRLIWPPGWIQ